MRADAKRATRPKEAKAVVTAAVIIMATPLLLINSPFLRTRLEDCMAWH